MPDVISAYQRAIRQTEMKPGLRGSITVVDARSG
jgi:hypothetical protein